MMTFEEQQASDKAAYRAYSAFMHRYGDYAYVPATEQEAEAEAEAVTTFTFSRTDAPVAAAEAEHIIRAYQRERGEV